MASGEHLGRHLLIASVWCTLIVAGCGESDSPTGPDTSQAGADRAYADFAAGRYAEAAAAFARLVNARPDDAKARRHWAYALAALGQFDDVDRVLRTAPVGPPTPRTQTSDQAGGDRTSADREREQLMLWRQAFNVYRYYYHVTSPSPSGVFRVATIRDALEAEDLSDVPIGELADPVLMRLEDLFELLTLWVRWDRVARDADLFPNCQWVPVLVVSEPDPLRDRLSQLVELESRTGGAVWLHPDHHGNWLAHPGAMPTDGVPFGAAGQGATVPDELTETAGPVADLVQAWTALAQWLDKELTSPAVAVLAAVRSGPAEPFDRRIALAGHLRNGHLLVERITTAGPRDAALQGYAEYRRLCRVSDVRITSDVEIDSMSAAYSADGSDPKAVRVDRALRAIAPDRVQLACLLSYVRFGAALFGEPVVMATTAPGD